MKGKKRFLIAMAMVLMLIVAAGCNNDTPSSTTNPPSAPTEDKKEPVEKDPQASEDKDADKEKKYQEALNDLNAGNSYSAYEGFHELVGYKDSVKLQQEALIQNKLNFFGGEPVEWFHAHIDKYEQIPLKELADVLGGKTWLVPNLHNVGYMEHHYRSDGSGEIFDPYLGETWHDFSWKVTDKGIELDYIDAENTAPADTYKENYYKIADGVIMRFVPEAENQANPWMPAAFIDRDSKYGKRYLKACELVERLNKENAGKWSIKTGPQGLYFIVVEG